MCPCLWKLIQPLRLWNLCTSYLLVLGYISRTSINLMKRKEPLFVQTHPHGREWEAPSSSNPCIHLFIHPSCGLWLVLAPERIGRCQDRLNETSGYKHSEFSQILTMATCGKIKEAVFSKRGLYWQLRGEDDYCSDLIQFFITFLHNWSIN